MKLYLDIETLPDQKKNALDEYIADEIQSFKAPSMTIGQMADDLKMENDPSDKKSKAEWLNLWEINYKTKFCEQRAEEKWRKTALDGSRGQICVIGFALDDIEPISFYSDDEKEVLSLFFKAISSATSHYNSHSGGLSLIGHNILNFDLRFLYQRAVINCIKPSFELNYSRYSDRVFDTMNQWAGFNNHISLDALCKALSIESPKNGIDGSKVWDYWQEGKMNAVAEYCKFDVGATRQCYKKMTFNS